MKTFTLALASALALGVFAFAPTAAAREPNAYRVGYGELNLDTQAGAEVVLRRIRHAANQACGARSGLMPIAERMHTRACVRAESEGAVHALNNPTVTALYYQRTPHVILAQN